MRLAIKGHATRGADVIKLLEMLGGKNPYNYKGNYTKYYLIAKDKSIYLLDYLPKDVSAYTLEEIEELHPYKVGDKVIVRGYQEQGEDEITYMFITYDNDIKYKTKNHSDTRYFTADSLIPTENTAAINMNNIIKKDMKEIKIDIPKGYEFFGIDDDNKIVLTKKQLQYPKTYGECYDILGLLKPSDDDSNIYGYKTPLLSKLQKLLVCRDAYWKVAGNWKPDYTDDTQNKPCIQCFNGCIEKNNVIKHSRVLVFPTEEMRDAFYDNFKDLIEQCKELL